MTRARSTRTAPPPRALARRRLAEQCYALEPRVLLDAAVVATGAEAAADAVALEQAEQGASADAATTAPETRALVEALEAPEPVASAIDFEALYGHLDCDDVVPAPRHFFFPGHFSGFSGSSGAFDVGSTREVWYPGNLDGLVRLVPVGGVDAEPSAPVAGDDEGVFDTRIRFLDVLGNDESDRGLDAGSVRFVDAPVGATVGVDARTVTVPGEGTWRYDTGHDAVNFTPEPGFTGTPTPVRYVVDDIDGLTSNVAEIRLIDEHPPILSADAGVFTGGEVSVDVLANDVASDGIAPGSVALVDGSGERVASIETRFGEWQVRDDMLAFSPARSFTGAPPDVSYSASDPLGNFADPVEVVLEDRVAPVLTDRVEDFDGRFTYVRPIGNTDHGEIESELGIEFIVDGEGVEEVVVAGEGRWIAEHDWRYTHATFGDAPLSIGFEPESGFRDAPSPVDFRVTDVAGNVSNTATVALLDRAAPVIAGDSVQLRASGPVRIDVLANDGNSGERHRATMALLCLPEGSIRSADWQIVDVPGEGRWQIEADGAVSFVPEAGFVGSPRSIAYGLADELGNAIAAEVRVDVALDASDRVVQLDAVDHARVDVLTGVVGLRSDTSYSVSLLDARGVQYSALGGFGERSGQGHWTVSGDALLFRPWGAAAELEETAVRYVVKGSDGSRAVGEVRLDFTPEPVVAEPEPVVAPALPDPVDGTASGDVSTPDPEAGNAPAEAAGPPPSMSSAQAEPSAADDAATPEENQVESEIEALSEMAEPDEDDAAVHDRPATIASAVGEPRGAGSADGIDTVDAGNAMASDGPGVGARVTPPMITLALAEETGKADASDATASDAISASARVEATRGMIEPAVEAPAVSAFLIDDALARGRAGETRGVTAASRVAFERAEHASDAARGVVNPMGSPWQPLDDEWLRAWALDAQQAYAATVDASVQALVSALTVADVHAVRAAPTNDAAAADNELREPTSGRAGFSAQVSRMAHERGAEAAHIEAMLAEAAA